MQLVIHTEASTARMRTARWKRRARTSEVMQNLMLSISMVVCGRSSERAFPSAHAINADHINSVGQRASIQCGSTCIHTVWVNVHPYSVGQRASIRTCSSHDVYS
jgi:hypothetical protein